MATQENNSDRIALLQGTLDLQILKTLLLGPCDGQGVARIIQRRIWGGYLPAQKQSAAKRYFLNS
jgi:hypothetical protein